MSSVESLHYLTNAAGQPEAVVILLADWRELEAYYRQLYNRELVLKGMQDALREVKQLEAGQEPEITLDDFLKEL